MRPNSHRQPKKNIDRRGYRAFRKARLVAHKGGKCERCGGSFHPTIFEFHHRNPDLKESGLNSQMVGDRAWPWVLKEAEKCHLLCANCHREVHVFNDLRFLESGENENLSR